MTEDVERSADSLRTCLKDRDFLSNFEKILIFVASAVMPQTGL